MFSYRLVTIGKGGVCKGEGRYTLGWTQSTPKYVHVTIPVHIVNVTVPKYVHVTVPVHIVNVTVPKYVHVTVPVHFVHVTVPVHFVHVTILKYVQ